MNEPDYSDDDFPTEFDEQHEGIEVENPYLIMSEGEFRTNMVNNIAQVYQNQNALNEATTKAFELMEKRLADSEELVRKLTKKIYAYEN